MDIKNIDASVDILVASILSEPHHDPDWEFPEKSIIDFDFINHEFGSYRVNPQTRFEYTVRFKGKSTVRQVVQSFAENYILWCYDNSVVDARLELVICEIIEQEESYHISFTLHGELLNW